MNIYLSLYLEKELKKLSPLAFLKFKKFTTSLDKELQTESLPGVCWMINEVGSGDTFWDFRSWIIYMGKTVYEISQNNPDDLIDFVNVSVDGYCLLVDGGPSVSLECLYSAKEIQKIPSEELMLHEKALDKIRDKIIHEKLRWEKYVDLKEMYPNLAEYVMKRDGENCFEEQDKCVEEYKKRMEGE